MSEKGPNLSRCQVVNQSKRQSSTDLEKLSAKKLKMKRNRIKAAEHPEFFHNGKLICALCLYAPMTRNRSRDLLDHMVRVHFEDKIRAALPVYKPFACPHDTCNVVCRDWQSLMRHYSGKHGIVKQLLNEAILSRLPSHTSHANTDLHHPSSSSADSPLDRRVDHTVPPVKPGQVSYDSDESLFIDDNGDEWDASELVEPVHTMPTELGESEEQYIPTPPLSVESDAAPQDFECQIDDVSIDNVCSTQLKCPLCDFSPHLCNDQGEALCDHLAQVHFLDRLRADLPERKPYICPERDCHTIFGQWRDLMRHFMRQHKAFERYLAADVDGNLLVIPDDEAQKQSLKVNKVRDNSEDSATSSLSLNDLYQYNSKKHNGPSCILCGFIPRTINKYREVTDHMIRFHFRDRIKAELPHCRPFDCPVTGCDFGGKDWQTLMRHYTGKHHAVRRYLTEALLANQQQSEEDIVDELGDGQRSVLDEARLTGDSIEELLIPQVGHFMNPE